MTTPKLELLGMELWRIDRQQLLSHLFAELDAGRGGWIITANLDFMRRFDRHPEMRDLYRSADIRVADGMPLVWASHLKGEPVPERVPGSGLLSLLAERASQRGRSLYLLGGAEGAAAAAAEKLQAQYPGLSITGWSSPWVSSPPKPAEVEGTLAALRAAPADIILVGLGSPKQEQLIAALRPHFPRAWMMGVGISFSFIAGTIKRAPPILQKTGLEWVHRLAQEPRRLSRRYLIEDLPFSFELFVRSYLERRRSRSG